MDRSSVGNQKGRTLTALLSCCAVLTGSCVHVIASWTQGSGKGVIRVIWYVGPKGTLSIQNDDGGNYHHMYRFVVMIMIWRTCKQVQLGTN